MDIVGKSIQRRRNKDYGRTYKAGGETGEGEPIIESNFLFGSSYVVNSVLYGSE